MTPLQKVAMGLLIVLLDAPFSGYDAVPDPVGWVLVALGILGMRHRLRASTTLLALVAGAGVVSVAVFPPQVSTGLSASGAWAVSLPQIAFTVVLCGSMADLVRASESSETRGDAGDDPRAARGSAARPGVPDPDIARRYDVLRWVFVALAVAPVLVYGGGVAALLVPVAVLAVLANVYLVYLLLRYSRREFALP